MNATRLPLPRPFGPARGRERTAARARCAGSTVIEMVISCGILAIAVGATLSVMVASQAGVESGVAANVLDARARALLERIAQEVRQASATTLLPPNPNRSTTLAFQQNAGYVAGVVTWGPLISYSLVAMPTGLSMPPLFACLRTSGAAAVSLGGEIAPNGLTFTQTAGGLVIAVTLQRTLPSGETITRTATTTVSLRN